MTLTDTHCHLYFNDFDDDRAHVLARAIDSGVERILVPGIDLQTSRSAIQLAEDNKVIYSAVGVHPNSANNWDVRTIGYLDELTSHPKVIAIGEIGLDYYRGLTSPLLQKQIFRDQLGLAEHLELPVVIHTRNSSISDRSCIIDTLEILSEFQTVGVLHSFSGNSIEAEEAIALGYFLGITGPVTYKSATELQTVVASVSIDHLLIETDSPFLAPVPHRGKRNEPAYVSFIAEKIGEIHNQLPGTVAKITHNNSSRLFEWGY